MYRSIPPEIIGIIGEYMDDGSLYELRGASRLCCCVLSGILLRRKTSRHWNVLKRFADSKALSETMKSEMHMKLKHYNSFLTNTSDSDINDVIWCWNPPAELPSVCRCLCILYILSPPRVFRRLMSRATAKNIKTVLPWHLVQVTMSNSQFRKWYSGLSATIERVPLGAATFVEEIIVSDPTLTYDRLRESSPTGYRLLIIVSACLQHCLISKDIRYTDIELGLVEREFHSLGRSIKLLGLRSAPSSARSLPLQSSDGGSRCLPVSPSTRSETPAGDPRWVP